MNDDAPSPHPAPAPRADPTRPSPHLLPAMDAFVERPADQLPPEEQMARFLLWLKIHDAGHQPC